MIYFCALSIWVLPPSPPIKKKLCGGSVSSGYPPPLLLSSCFLMPPPRPIPPTLATVTPTTLTLTPLPHGLDPCPHPRHPPAHHTVPTRCSTSGRGAQVGPAQAAGVSQRAEGRAGVAALCHGLLATARGQRPTSGRHHRLLRLLEGAGQREVCVCVCVCVCVLQCHQRGNQ